MKTSLKTIATTAFIALTSAGLSQHAIAGGSAAGAASGAYVSGSASIPSASMQNAASSINQPTGIFTITHHPINLPDSMSSMFPNLPTGTPVTFRGPTVDINGIVSGTGSDVQFSVVGDTAVQRLN